MDDSGELGGLGADYAAAGFGARLGWGAAPAVLVVDVCRAYVDRTSPLYAGVEDAVASAGRVVAAARTAGVTVVFTKVSYRPGGADGGVFYRKVPSLKLFEQGSPWADFLPDPAPAEGELVVDKQYPSAFSSTPLAAALTAARVDTLVVCGLTTSGCVRATAVDACSLGFAPLVVREAVGDRDRRPHEQALFDLDAKYADVVHEADVVAHLEGIRS